MTMTCAVIGDLLPLYADGCCSEESADLVKEHLQTCAACRAALSAMTADAPQKTTPPPEKATRVRALKASLLQSVLLFLSFGLVTAGVTLEAGTPAGPDNGFWAAALLIPATGFLLSLANWYFLRLYVSRRRFVCGSCLLTAAITAAADTWAVLHYGFAALMPAGWICGAVLTAVLCLLSALLSGRYATMMGKE